MDGVQEGVIQARGAAWPFYVWFKEGDQTYCCDVPLDSLLAGTAKAWALELSVAILQLSQTVWTLFMPSKLT